LLAKGVVGAAPPDSHRGGSTFQKRLQHYLTGIAIGCVIAGLIFYGRWMMFRMQQQQAQQQVAPRPQPAGGRP